MSGIHPDRKNSQSLSFAHPAPSTPGERNKFPVHSKKISVILFFPIHLTEGTP